MSGSNTTTLAEVFKETYPIDEIARIEQLNTAFKKEVEVDETVEYSGATNGTFKFPVKAYGPNGQKMTNELESIPGASPGSYVQGTSYLKEYIGTLQFSKRALVLGANNTTAFSQVKALEAEGLIENAGKYFNRQMANGDGSGLMTLVSGTQASVATIAVDDATPFIIGQLIDIYDAAGAVLDPTLDGLTVVDVDILNTPNTITVDATVSVVDDGEIYLSGVHANASADGKEMIGLPLVTDDGTLATSFQGIVRSGAGEVPNYRGITKDAGGLAISVDLINNLVTRAFRIGGTDYFKSNNVYHLTSPEQWRAYAALTNPQVRFNPSDAPDGNKPFTVMECMGKRVVVDTDVARDRWYIVKKDAIKLAVAKQLDWESDLGQTEMKWMSGTTQGVMLLYALQQMFAKDVRAVTALTNLVIPAI